jgi:hypothetical protein
VSKMHRQNPAWKLAVTSAFALVVSACGADTRPATEVTSQSSALHNDPNRCVPGTPCKVELGLPPDIDAAGAPLRASHSVSLGDSVALQTSDGAPAPLLNTGEGTVDIGSRSIVGSIWTGGRVRVGSRAQVGAVWAGGKVSQENKAIVRGPVRKPTGSPATLSWSVTFPQQRKAGVELSHGRSAELTPGYYESLVVRQRATVRLKTGSYYFDTVTIAEKSSLVLDNTDGTVVLNIRQGLDHDGTLKTVGGAPSDALLVVFDRCDIRVAGALGATLVAPYADVTIGRGTYLGSFSAKTLEVQDDTILRFASLSKLGPAYAGLAIQTEAASDSVLPIPVPSPVGLTPEQFFEAQGAFVAALRDAQYRGPLVELPAHPELARAQDLTGSTVLAESPAPAAPPGSAEQSLPSAVARVNQAYPALASQAPPPRSPRRRACPLGGATTPPPPVSSQPRLSKRVDQGDPKNPDALLDPYWRAYGYFDAGQESGAPGGFFVRAGAGFSTGVVAFHHDVTILDVCVAALGSTGGGTRPSAEVADMCGQGLESQANARGPVAQARGSFKLNGVELPPFPLDGASGVRTDFCEDCASKLFPTDVGMTFGAFSINFNVGVDMKVPVSLGLEPNGVALTIAPMARAFLTARAGFGQGVKVSAQADLDVIRVDVPIETKLGWKIDQSPDTCAAVLQGGSSIQFRLTTLSGKVFAVLSISISTPVGTVERDIARIQVMSFPGFTYAPEKVRLFALPELPIVAFDPSQCQTGGLECTGSSVDFSGLRQGGQPRVIRSSPDYDHDDCPGQLVVEDSAPFALPDDSIYRQQLAVRVGWDNEHIDAARFPCADRRGRVTAFTYGQGQWTRHSAYEIRGLEESGQCGAVAVPLDNHDSVPRVLIKLRGKDIERVRIAAVGAVGCESLPLRVEQFAEPCSDCEPVTRSESFTYEDSLGGDSGERDVGGACAPGQHRVSYAARKASGDGHCEPCDSSHPNDPEVCKKRASAWLSDDVHDCRLKVHYGLSGVLSTSGTCSWTVQQEPDLD